MTLRAPVRGTSLSIQTQEILIERIKSGLYSPKTQIPPENELAEEFNVSRATIRSAISALVERGLLVRRHGVGTFVSQRSRIANPLNEAVDFNYLISGYGFNPGVKFVSSDLVQPSTIVAEALRIQPDQIVLKSHKIFTADNDPMIYCLNYMPVWMFDEELVQEVESRPEITEPIYDFLEHRCNQRVAYHIAKLRADIVKNCEILKGSLDPITPVLVIQETAFNPDEIPVWYSVEYFPRNDMVFELIRHRGLNSK